MGSRSIGHGVGNSRQYYDNDRSIKDPSSDHGTRLSFRKMLYLRLILLVVSWVFILCNTYAATPKKPVTAKSQTETKKPRYGGCGGAIFS